MTSKFCFIPIIVPRDIGVIQSTMEDLLLSRLRSRRFYERFAEVPVTAKTLVLRIDTTKNRKKLHVFEVAHSKLMNVDGKKKVYYKTSHDRPNYLEFFLSL